MLHTGIPKPFAVCEEKALQFCVLYWDMKQECQCLDTFEEKKAWKKNGKQYNVLFYASSVFWRVKTLPT